MATATYVRRLLSPPARSFFVFGPRGAGKSTWVREELPGAHRIDLLDEARYQTYLARPGQFADELRVLKAGSTVCVDEIQRVPNLLNEVQGRRVSETADGIEVWPVAQFLQALEERTLWP